MPKPLATHLKIFADTKKDSGINNFAITYGFSINGKAFLIDTSCGEKRCRELLKYTKETPCHMILSTHYHNDHISNNGRLASKNTHILYHFRARSKVRYLRTNSTGQILMMYRYLDKRDFLRSLGFFSENIINMAAKNRIVSGAMKSLLFILAYILSLKSIGRIYTGRKYITYLEESDKRDTDLGGMILPAWRIEEGLYAIETPGHTDCHISFYIPETRTLFAGDSLNFLNPNDIQFGDLADTMKTQKLILMIVKKLRVENLCLGHYLPVTGNKVITEYVEDIIRRHEHVYNLVSGYVKKNHQNKTFSELYSDIASMEDESIRKLSKITFPRSTLVFLDVYLLKVINTLGITCCKKPVKAAGTR